MKKMVLAVALMAIPVAARAENCTIATSGNSPVAQACKTGGREAAKAEMKNLVKLAKAHGVTFKCNACHQDFDSFKLKKGVDGDFKKLLAAAGVK